MAKCINKIAYYYSTDFNLHNVGLFLLSRNLVCESGLLRFGLLIDGLYKNSKGLNMHLLSA